MPVEACETWDCVSYLTQLMVCSPNTSDEALLDDLSFELTGDRFVQVDERSERVGTLRPLQHEFGGWKAASGCVWAGVLDHANEDAILVHLAEQSWAEPDTIQILIKTEDEREFRLYMIRNDRLVLCSPEPLPDE
ncbi:MAG: hypothetical protein KGQ66_11305 [Acidobacteriota bacterium]|nr:hypothetical protein [Acidobacteriota bacterium]